MLQVLIGAHQGKDICGQWVGRIIVCLPNAVRPRVDRALQAHFRYGSVMM